MTVWTNWSLTSCRATTTWCKRATPHRDWKPTSRPFRQAKRGVMSSTRCSKPLRTLATLQTLILMCRSNSNCSRRKMTHSRKWLSRWNLTWKQSSTRWSQLSMNNCKNKQLYKTQANIFSSRPSLKRHRESTNWSPIFPRKTTNSKSWRLSETG